MLLELLAHPSLAVDFLAVLTPVDLIRLSRVSRHCYDFIQAHRKRLPAFHLSVWFGRESGFRLPRLTFSSSNSVVPLNVVVVLADEKKEVKKLSPRAGRQEDVIVYDCPEDWTTAEALKHVLDLFDLRNYEKLELSGCDVAVTEVLADKQELDVKELQVRNLDIAPEQVRQAFKSTTEEAATAIFGWDVHGLEAPLKRLASRCESVKFESLQAIFSPDFFDDFKAKKMIVESDTVPLTDGQFERWNPAVVRIGGQVDLSTCSLVAWIEHSERRRGDELVLLLDALQVGEVSTELKKHWPSRVDPHRATFLELPIGRVLVFAAPFSDQLCFSARFLN